MKKKGCRKNIFFTSNKRWVKILNERINIPWEGTRKIAPRKIPPRKIAPYPNPNQIPNQNQGEFVGAQSY